MFFFGFSFLRGIWGLLFFPLAVYAAYWTYKDSTQKDMSSWFWSGISFSLFPIGFLIYLGYSSIKNKNRV